MAETKSRLKVIDEQLNVGTQDVVLTRIEEKNGKKFKISIKSDSYDFQSHAYISLWDGVKWHQVASIHYGEMKTPSKLCYHSNVNKTVGASAVRDQFNSDILRLRKTAHSIVF